MIVENITDCSTSRVRGLSRQIIAEMNLLAAGVLVNFADLPVDALGESVFLFLQPAAKEALRDAIADHSGSGSDDRGSSGGGGTLKITSAYRTVAQQYLLRRRFQEKKCGITAAAKPGRSNHEDGLAIDTPDFAAWRPALEASGWQWLGPGDSVHFTYVGAGRRDDIGSMGVKAFQRLWNRHHPENQIAEDGDFGAQTAACMAQSPADGFPINRLLRRTQPVMTGDDVRRVQTALLHAGFPDVPQNGVFGPETERFLRNFQAQKELAVDGIVGPSTQRELGLIF